MCIKEIKKICKNYNHLHRNQIRVGFKILFMLKFIIYNKLFKKLQNMKKYMINNFTHCS